MAKQKETLTEADKAEALRIVKASDQPLDPLQVSKLGTWSRKVISAEVGQLLDDWVCEQTLELFSATTAKGKPRYWDRDPKAVIQQAVVEAVRQAPEPVTTRQLKRLVKLPFKISDSDRDAALTAAVESGQLVAIPAKTKAGGARYYFGSLTDYAHTCLLTELRKKSELSDAALRKLLPWLSPEEQSALIAEMSQAGNLFVHPPLASAKSKGTLWGLQPPTPDPYLAPVRTQLLGVIEKLRQAAVAEAEIRRSLVSMLSGLGIPIGVPLEGAAPRGPEGSKSPLDLLALMERVDSRAMRGALVTARVLRLAAGLPKAEFDTLAIGLARQGKVDLHEHDFPTSLSDSERDELITDGQGRYYIGLAIRS